MLTEVERTETHVIFKVSTKDKKTEKFLAYRLFPIAGLGDSRRGQDFVSLDAAQGMIPTNYKKIDQNGVIAIYQLELNNRPRAMYCCGKVTASKAEIALQPIMDFDNVRRAAALANEMERSKPA